MTLKGTQRSANGTVYNGATKVLYTTVRGAKCQRILSTTSSADYTTQVWLCSLNETHAKQSNEKHAVRYLIKLQHRWPVTLTCLGINYGMFITSTACIKALLVKKNNC